MKKMKKVLAGLLAATMVMSMNISAFAYTSGNVNVGKNESGNTVYAADEATVTFTKTYKAVWGGTNPEETFSFIVEEGATVNGESKTIDNNDEASYPATLPSITSAVYEDGDASVDGADRPLTITLPKYERVGVYYYTITENVPKDPTTGVVYHPDPIMLKVTVVQDEDAADGRVRVAAVHCESPLTDTTTGKTDGIINEYYASGLEITKNVTGNLGEKDKYFTVTVNITAPNTNMKSEITVNTGELTYANAEGEDYNPKSITQVGTYLFKIKDGETIKLGNIPKGVTYTVVENEENANGYTTSYSDFDGEINTKENDKVIITNDKDSTVDTGIILDSAPYVLLLALAAVGMFAVVSKKREDEI